MLKCYETDRLILRQINDDDLRALFDNFSDRELMKFYDTSPVDTPEQAEDILHHWRMRENKGLGLRWAIAVQDSDRLIGTCGFHNIDAASNRAEIGYEVNRDYWGRGIMTEVLPVALKHAFDLIKLKQVTALISKENKASIALVKKFGFQYEGVLHDHAVGDGRRMDMLSFGLQAARREILRQPGADQLLAF